VCSILAAGAAKYGEWNWLNVTIPEHINHALVHINAYGAGDRQDDHMGHAACRLAMALELILDKEEQSERDNKKEPFGFAGAKR
jgi:hypothetical protein